MKDLLKNIFVYSYPSLVWTLFSFHLDHKSYIKSTNIVGHCHLSLILPKARKIKGLFVLRERIFHRNIYVYSYKILR